jgi:hypothetical protein
VSRDVVGRLPRNAIERTELLVARSQPSPRAPIPTCVTAEASQDIRESRSTRAVMFASMEDHSDRVRALSEEMDAAGVVLDLVDAEDESSLVRHMALAAGSLDGEEAEAVPSTIAVRAPTADPS